MNREKLKADWYAEEQQAQIKGWDFGYLEHRFDSGENNLPWDFRQVIRQYVKPTDRLLDIDTGGGEFLLSLGHAHALTSATEGYAPNIVLCKEKFDGLGIDFHPMTDARKMPFADRQFDVILNRHGRYDVSELLRVLKPGGFFLTQQVGEWNDWELIKKVLPDAQRQFKGHCLVSQVKVFQDADFEILEQGEAYCPIRFYDTGAFVWFAKVIAWEFVDFSVEKCFENLLSVAQEIQNKGFVSGRIHRFYLVAKKK
ncbi:MAG: class I SAM-dependent methyltransferase [Oscillospiraceae bacterium]|nr:class I SAM-dependent methyltransferase [Oscillospiraceae bacterium]